MILNWNAARRVSRWFHRWVGLTLGLVFVLYGLTGSYIVYMDEIEAWMDPSMKRSIASTPDVSLAALAAATQLPEGALRIRIPESPTRNIEFLFHREAHLRMTEYVDPSSMEHVGQRHWASSLTGFLYRFHHDLFLGKPGKTVTAVQALFVFAMLVMGLVIWWPKRGARARALTPDALRHARTTLKQYLELHKLVGVYVTLLLLMAVGTGIFIARPDWFLTFGAPAPPMPAHSIQYAALDEAFARAGLAQRGSTLRLRPESVTLYRADGAVYLLDAAEGLFVPRVQASTTERIYDTLRDVHAGRYFGRYGSGVTFMIGLLPLLFYVTGVYIWWKKRAFRLRAARAIQGATA